jgi:hypothetical protein
VEFEHLTLVVISTDWTGTIRSRPQNKSAIRGAQIFRIGISTI